MNLTICEWTKTSLQCQVDGNVFASSRERKRLHDIMWEKTSSQHKVCENVLTHLALWRSFHNVWWVDTSSQRQFSENASKKSNQIKSIILILLQDMWDIGEIYTQRQVGENVFTESGGTNGWKIDDKYLDNVKSANTSWQRQLGQRERESAFAHAWVSVWESHGQNDLNNVKSIEQSSER